MDKQRKAFNEFWKARNERLGRSTNQRTSLFPDGSFFCEDAQAAWEAWQAAQEQLFFSEEQIREVAVLIASSHGFIVSADTNFEESENPRTQRWWLLACQIIEMLEGSNQKAAEQLQTTRTNARCRFFQN